MVRKWTKDGTVCAVVLLAAAAASAETHWNLQAVDANGVKTWNGALPVTVTGIILNNPQEMLDPTPDFQYIPWSFYMGGQWQVFVQSSDPAADHAGTALWMGQNYGNTWRNNPAFSYTDDQWLAELDRLNHDPATGHLFQKGDLVQVYAPNVGFYGGKTNINESHDNNPAMDFGIALIEASVGLPAPQEITLADLDADPATAQNYDPAYPRFDSSRLTGAEYYQGMLVHLNGVYLVDDSGWDKEEWSERLCTVSDGQRELPLRMPRGSIVDLGDPPTGWFHVSGILNQESGSGQDGRYGYELYVTGIDRPQAEIPEPACATIVALWAGSLAAWRRSRRAQV